jgi:hypothetical protein
MRARQIKPGLLRNDLLGAADPHITILFAGLWMMADREGRLEDRPLRICAEAFPYRRRVTEKRVDAWLTWLHDNSLIGRYIVNGQRYIQVLAFSKHQNPHKDEKASTIPALTPKSHSAGTLSAPSSTPCTLYKSTESATLTPDSGLLTPDSSLREVRAREVSRGAIEGGDGLTRMPSAEAVLAEMNNAWKRDVEGVNLDALQGFIDFVATDINPPSKRKEFSPSARRALAKRLAGMGDEVLQAQVVAQSISADHAVLYALKDRPSKGAADSAQRRQNEQRELTGLKTRAQAIKFRAPHRGEDLGDYRFAVERAEREAADAAYRNGLANRKGRDNAGAKSAAELLNGAR